VDKVHAEHRLEPIIIQRNALQAHLGGEDLTGLEGFAVEVKFCEELKLESWWAQALRQAERKNAVPVLIYRSSFEDWTVRWRAYVNTPGDRDQIEMDLEVGIDEFLVWFESAYDEKIAPTVKVTPPPAPSVLHGINIHRAGPPKCTCVEAPGRYCEACHL
jgi:hypothetical protein